VICFDVLGTRKCQNFKFLTKSRFTTNRTCYTLLNFRKNPTGGVSIEMAEPINVIPFSVYKKYFGNVKIIKDNTRLMENTGSRIKILGYITVPALYKNNSCSIKMFVSKSNGRSVLGRETKNCKDGTGCDKRRFQGLFREIPRRL
jgi:hypothetical protein